MSGYASVIFGLFAIWAAAQFIKNSTTWTFIVLAPIVLLTAILYYEMNIAIMPAIAVLAIGYHTSDSLRRKSSLRKLSIIAAVYCIPASITIVLQKMNAAASVSYEGTEIALTLKAINTFGKMMVSSLPFSSWHLGFDWVTQYPTFKNSMLLLTPLFILMFGAIGLIKRRPSRKTQTKGMFWLFSSLAMYWIFATAIQSFTVKVQNEASRIGNVYNFYAVGSTVFVIFFSAVFLIVFQSLKKPLAKAFILTPVFLAVGSQVFLNLSIQQQHFSMLPQTRNLLVSYSERLPIESRCNFLQIWLGMGWPPYYSNSMTTGLEKSYQERFKEPFCGRF